MLVCLHLACLLFLFASSIQAEAGPTPQLKITHFENNSLLHVQAQQVEFSVLLQSLSLAAGFAMHYQQLPTQTQVNGDCIAENLAELLSCLLGAPVNTVIRYSDQGRTQELWLLPADKKAVNTSFMPDSGVDIVVESESDDLLDQAQSKDLSERLQAVAEIGVTDVKDKALAKAVLQNALNDEHPGVRAKAIASLSRIGGVAETRPQISEMLQDKDVSVRLAAVVAAYQDREILQQAQDDADEQVRMVASVSLQKILAAETLQ